MFFHIFKAGTSDGASKAWETRRGTALDQADKNRPNLPGGKNWGYTKVTIPMRGVKQRPIYQKQTGVTNNPGLAGEVIRTIRAANKKIRARKWAEQRGHKKISKAGTSEGAEKAWASRRAGGHQHPLVGPGQGVRVHATVGNWGFSKKPSFSKPNKEVLPYQDNKIGFLAKLKKFENIFKAGRK